MLNVVCIGTGKLAYHLMPQLEANGCRIIQLYNRTSNHVQALAGRLHSPMITDKIENISSEADLYFFTLRDDVIPDVAEALRSLEDNHKIFVHCSGVTALDVLPFQRRGSLYPLQSFSYANEINWPATPLLVTAIEQDVKSILKNLAQRISEKVYIVTDEQKSRLHLAAVFANNFSNHMLTVAAEICKDHGLSFDMLKPLIRQTFEKALASGPEESQTGPAIRHDQQSIDKHLHLLVDHPELEEIYRLITQHIQTTHQ